jgi:hypothetical protein
MRPSLVILAVLLAASCISAAPSTDDELVLEDSAAVTLAPAKKTVPVPQTAAKKDSLKSTADEELILDDMPENLMLDVVPAAKSAPAVKTAPGVKPDSAGDASGGAARDSEASAESDSAGAADTAASTTLSTPADAAEKAAAAAVTIDKVRSVNFAANLKDYRSPRLAMLLSLILPGAGQAYAKSTIWAAGFVAVEAVVIGTGVALAAKSRSAKRNAHAYADAHYRVTGDSSFKSYADSLYQFVTAKYPAGKADSICQAILSYTIGDTAAFFGDAKNRNDNYYESIDEQEWPTVRGWDDVTPARFTRTGFTGLDTAVYRVSDTGYFFFPKSDTLGRLYGVSVNQVSYGSMLDDARRWANWSRTTLTSLLVNHLASAVMAGIAAQRHNEELLGKESVWRHIDFIEQRVNTGSETVPGYALEVAF